MLIEFQVGNFLSFKNMVTFSLAASSSKHELDESNTFTEKKWKLLKSAVLYGANASGKSNLITAMAFLKGMILSSNQTSLENEKIHVIPFKLSTASIDKPSHFEVSFIYEEIKYRYGFELTSTQITREWLFYDFPKLESRLFIRDGDTIQLGPQFKEGKGLMDKTRKNTLFLSVVAQFNGAIALKLINWFKTCNIISGLDDQSYLNYTVSKLKDESFKKEIHSFLLNADLGIKDIAFEQKKMPLNMVNKLDPVFLPEFKQVLINNQFTQIFTQHDKYDDQNNTIGQEKFNLMGEESKGTVKLFSISAPIIDTLQQGKILIVDELDARLHPLLTRFLVSLFSSELNKKNAQLIFSSHDTSLLTNGMFRRDQIWFAEKDKYGASDLYSLAEFQVRKDASYNKDYIMGKYGAIPFIGNLHSLAGQDGSEL